MASQPMEPARKAEGVEGLASSAGVERLERQVGRVAGIAALLAFVLFTAAFFTRSYLLLLAVGLVYIWLTARAKIACGRALLEHKRVIGRLEGRLAELEARAGGEGAAEGGR